MPGPGAGGDADDKAVLLPVGEGGGLPGVAGDRGRMVHGDGGVRLGEAPGVGVPVDMGFAVCARAYCPRKRLAVRS